LYVSLPALWTSLLVTCVFLALKMVTKIAGVFPLARLHYMKVKEASYTTLLMATGLTFGTISALFGLQNKIIDQNQYTILVSAVILSAFAPTLIAQKFSSRQFKPCMPGDGFTNAVLGSCRLKTLTEEIIRLID